MELILDLDYSIENPTEEEILKSISLLFKKEIITIFLFKSETESLNVSWDGKHYEIVWVISGSRSMHIEEKELNPKTLETILLTYNNQQDISKIIEWKFLDTAGFHKPYVFVYTMLGIIGFITFQLNYLRIGFFSNIEIINNLSNTAKLGWMFGFYSLLLPTFIDDFKNWKIISALKKFYVVLYYIYLPSIFVYFLFNLFN